MLTQAIIKSAQGGPRAYKMFDTAGLFLFVAPSGTKSWRLKYRRDGREQLLTLGRYPELGLHEARALRDAARARIAKGHHTPLSEDAALTFEQLARAWHSHLCSRWSDAHARDVLASLERDVFPDLGDRAPGSISAAELLRVLKPVEARGCVATAQRLRQRLSAIFGYGVSIDLCQGDPAAVIGRAMAAGGLVTPHAALTDIEDVRALLRATDSLVVHNRLIPLAHRFLALTAVRLDAVRGMCWDEVEGLDGETPIWRVPPERMKLSKAKKGEARFAHVVPLSAAAVAVLHDVRRANMHARDAYMHHGDANMHSGDADCTHRLVFPGSRKNRPIGENAIRDLIGRTRFQGRHVPHGWRASFSTILNEHLGGEWRADIDRALAHVPKDKVEAAYNRAQQLDRRRALFDRWGEMLSG